MKKIYLVRHGQTEANVGDIVQGSDAFLSDMGHKQAHILADRLQFVSFQHLIVSDYERTRQTIKPLLEKCSVVPEYTSLVRETKRPTQFLGLKNTSDEFQAYVSESDLHINDPDWHFADEENFFDIVERVKKLFVEIESMDGDIAIITHGRFIIYIVMFVLTGTRLDINTWINCRYGFETQNTGITVLGFNEKFQGWKLLTFNDHAHFAE